MTFEKHLHPDGVTQYNITVGERGWKCIKKPGEGWRIWSIVNGEKKELEAAELRTFRGVIARDIRHVIYAASDFNNEILDGIEVKP